MRTQFIRSLLIILTLCLAVGPALSCRGSGSSGAEPRTDRPSPESESSSPDGSTSRSLSRPASTQTKPATVGELVAPFPRDPDPRERHLKNLRQLTFGGENAEAYFSADGKRLIFQSTRHPYDCDQIFTMTTAGQDVKLVSTGTGRTTCSFFWYPESDALLFSSTHESAASCPEKPDFSQGYVWPIYESYEIYRGGLDGQNLVNLSQQPGYDAEATFAFDGSKIVFTSMRDGDLDLYSMNPDGTEVVRLTDTPGYDGGAFYSYDGSKIVYRASHPKGDELEDYQALLREGLIRPTQLDVYVMNSDGSGVTQVTDNGAANFGPFMHPDGERVIFSSNLHSLDKGGREFDLFIINVDGTGLEQVTFTAAFDGFPMFSRDGKTLVFCSNRHNAKRGDTNVFICDWVN